MGPALKTSPDMMAMNVLGDEWLAYLNEHPPEQGYRSAWDGYKGGFFPWLWMECNEDPRLDSLGRSIPEGRELELFRKSLPRFAVFQPWFYWKREQIQELALRKSDAILQRAVDIKKSNPERRIGDIVRTIQPEFGETAR